MAVFANLNILLEEHGVKALEFKTEADPQSDSEKIAAFCERWGIAVPAEATTEEGAENE